MDDQPITQETGYTLGAGEGEITAGEQSLEFIFAEGNPLKESVAWRGPIVMNTDEELYEAFEELRQGTFIK